MIHPETVPALVFADQHGNIHDFPGLHMTGMARGNYFTPAREDLIALPAGSELFVLPGRLPVGADRITGEPLLLEEDPFQPGRSIQAVAAFMAPAHTATWSAAFQTGDQAPLLPLFAYTAVGWLNGTFWVAGFRSDTDERQDHRHFKQTEINRRTAGKLKRFPDNRLVQHLGKCCLTYRCPAARNFFLDRWEAPLPTSPVCNANCLGCISLQPSQCCPATQDRIDFVPSAREVAQIAVDHLNRAPRPIVSFGQGCEGEPLLQAPLLEKAIGRIRKQTDRGTINLNSNSSLPEAVQRLASAGLDSLRVSMNSAQKSYYHRYYRPRGYAFEAVRDSITVMKRAGKFVSLNYFILPGFTDAHDETEALFTLIEETRPDCLQLRNLNMDPEWYLRSLECSPDQPLHTMRAWLSLVKKTFPALRLGYYNPCLNT